METRELTHLVNMKGIKCPKCNDSEEGPRPVYK